jgi:NTE family protein
MIAQLKCKVEEIGFIPMSKKTALVLTGGGARAAYQVGALRALAEILPNQANPFPILSGTSAGAINAGYLASRTHDWKNAISGLHQLWQALQLDHVYRTNGISLTRIAWGWMMRTLFGAWLKKRNRANFLLDTQPLRELLEREMSFAQIQKNFESHTLHGLSFSALDYSSGINNSFFHDSCKTEPWTRSGRVGVKTDLTANHVMASAAIPIFFPPIELDSQFFGDGSLKQLAPLSPALHMGADRILAISIRYEKKKSDDDESKHLPRHAPSLAEIGGQLMNSLFLDSLDGDLERLVRINETLVKNPGLNMKDVPVLVLKPSRNLEEVLPNLLEKFPPTLRFFLRGLGVSSGQGNALMSYLAFMPECIHPLIELGYTDTLQKREQILQFMN